MPVNQQFHSMTETAIRNLEKAEQAIALACDDADCLGQRDSIRFAIDAVRQETINWQRINPREGHVYVSRAFFERFIKSFADGP